jgi:hypothetical protein
MATPPVDPWLARRRLERAWQRHLEEGRVDGVRNDVVRSWERSSPHVPRDRVRAPLEPEDRARERWRASPLHGPVESIRHDLVRLAGDGDFVVAVTGPDGMILWTHGSRWMRTRAEDVHFVPGGRWGETAMGTNALGLSLAIEAPSQVFSAEHFSPAVHEWVCYSAPIADPVSGRPLGVVDLSTTWDRANPLALATATMIARTLELRVPDGTTFADGGGLELAVLGTPRVRLDGESLGVTPRQLEILTVLTLHPDGLDLDALHGAVYEDLRVSPTTCRAEVSHLRRLLGGRIGSRPYRLDLPVFADHVLLFEDLRAGRLRAAVERFGGPLLAASEAPAVVEHRRYLERALREAVIDAADPDLLFALGGRLPHEAVLHERACALLPPDDPRHALAKARLASSLA